MAIPSGTSDLILRLTNSDAPAMGAVVNRVENEVAIMTLARTALDPNFEPRVVPRIYGWAGTINPGTGEPQQGWILQELMPGVPLDEKLGSMELGEKKEIFSQIARLLKSLQDFPLPRSITKFGGLNFDIESNIISAPMTTANIGPWPSYEAAFEARLKQALERSDENPYIRGWYENGVRDRLEAFIERGLPDCFKSLESRDDRAIIHADFSKHVSLYVPNSTACSYSSFLPAASNLLFDISSGSITGLVDYDFSCVLHPSYEFFHSFGRFGGRLGGWSGIEGREERALKKAKLHGFPDPLPTDLQDGEGGQWKVAKAWEDALRNAACKRPMTIPGIDVVADVDTLLSSILPWRITSPDILSRQTDEVIENCRNENEKALSEILEHMGF